jgi:hypothetical protein
VGDVWVSHDIPPESDLEFDLELTGVRNRRAGLVVLIITLLMSLGCIGRLLIYLFTGVSVNAEVEDEDDNDSEGLRDDEYEEEEVEYEEDEVEDEDVMEEESEDSRELRNQRRLWLQNKGALTEARTLFSKPDFEIR